MPESEQYSADLVVHDLLEVCDHTGLEVFSVLGYSLTAAMAGWLAAASARVAAVVLGGFPLLGSYGAVLRGAEATAAAISQNEEANDALRVDFDSRAVLTFYRELAERTDDALVDLACPILAFWGTNDEVLQSFDTSADFRKDLEDRGVATLPIDGLDHVGAIVGLGGVVEELMNWLEQQYA